MPRSLEWGRLLNNDFNNQTLGVFLGGKTDRNQTKTVGSQCEEAIRVFRPHVGLRLTEFRVFYSILFRTVQSSVWFQFSRGSLCFAVPAT